MKNALIIVWCCVISLFVCHTLRSAHAENGGAQVLFVQGEVLTKTPDDAAWVPVAAGMVLPEGSEIKTASDASCEIAFDATSGNVIGIEGNTIISIDTLRPALLDLSEGRVFALITNLDKGSTFELRTPTAVAGARGTGWLTEATATQTVFKQYEGSIYAAGRDEDGNPLGEINLPEGFLVVVPYAQAPGVVLGLTDEDIAAWSLWKAEMEQHRGQSSGDDAIPSLAQAIQEELPEVFDQDSAFAADGIDFIVNLPGGEGFRGLGDFNLNDITNTTEGPQPPRPKPTVCSNCAVSVLDPDISPKPPPPTRSGDRKP